MKRISNYWPISTVKPLMGNRSPFLGGWLAASAVLLFALPGPSQAAQVRVPNGTLVRLRLHYVLTTLNAAKGDKIDFDVAQDVVVDNQVVIPKGAAASGAVVRVKGAGNRRAKDASITFRFMGVHAIDDQEIPLRLLPSQPRKKDPRQDEIVEDSAIPGLTERMIGAPVGKEYAAYTDADALVDTRNAPAPAPAAAPVATPVAAASEVPAETQPAAAQAAPVSAPAPMPSAASILGPESASVSFSSSQAGADIIIDGKDVGSTPSTLRLSPGRHLIEIHLGGYKTWQRTLRVEPGSQPSVKATLELGGN